MHCITLKVVLVVVRRQKIRDPPPLAPGLAPGTQ